MVEKRARVWMTWRIGLGIAVAAIGVALTAFVVVNARSTEASRALDQFRATAANVFATLVGDLHDVTNVMAVVSAYVAADGYSLENETRFQMFASVIQATTPAATLVSFAAHVPAANRSDFESAFGPIRQWNANGTTTYAADKDVYFPAAYVQPRSGPGYTDVSTYPGRASLFNSSIESREVKVSSVLRLFVNITTNSTPAGVILVYPVFAHSGVTSSGPLLGLTTILLVLSGFEHVAIPSHALTFTITDVTTEDTEASGPIVFSNPTCSQAGDCSEQDVWSSTTTFGGRTWKFSATARAPYLKSFNTSLPWIFLSVGLLCVALVLFLMYLLVRIDKAESIKVAALAASQAHHWLLNYVCHEVRNPLHGANESISRIRDLLCGTPGCDPSPRHRSQSVFAPAPADAVTPFTTTQLMETKPSHTSKRSSDGTVSQNPLISSASLTLVIPKPVHNTPRDVDASVTCQLLEEKDQLTQFLRHIERAVDDAVLCQRLTVGSDTVPVKPGPCNVREEVCAVVTKALPMMASGVHVTVRCIQPTVQDLTCEVDASIMAQAVHYGLLHAAKHTYKGAIAVDFCMEEVREASCVAAACRNPQPSHFLTIDIVYTGSYPTGDLTSVLDPKSRSLKRLVESNVAAPVLSFSSYTRDNASQNHSLLCCCPKTIVPHTSTYHIAAEPENYYRPHEVIMDVVAESDVMCIDTGTRLSLPICDELVNHMKGSIGLRPVRVAFDGDADEGMMSAYRLTLRFPVELRTPLHRTRMQSVQTQATNTATQTSVSMHTQRVLPEVASRDTNAGPPPGPAESSPEMFTTTVTVHSEPVVTEISPSSISAPPDPASTTTGSVTRSASPLLTPQMSPMISDAGNPSTPAGAGPTQDVVPPPAPAHVPFQCAVIVDDEAANRKIAERMFQRLRRAAATIGTTASEVVSPSLDIICLSDGTELLNVLSAMQDRQIPCLVLLDIWMPHSDGVSVCKSVRDSGLTHAVVAMTAHVEAGSIRKYRETGFNGVLSKPFSSEQLTNTLLRLAQPEVPAWIEPV